MSVQRSTNARRKRLQQRFCFCLAGISTGIFFAASVRADECVMAGAGEPELTCGVEPFAMNLDVPQAELPALFMHEPSPEIQASVADEGTPLPFAVSPSATGLSARVSLGTWRDYHSKTMARKIEEAKALAPRALALPKPVTGPATGLDIWSNVEAQ